MAEVNLECPGCSVDLLVPESLFGKVIRCPGCEAKLEIPVLKVKYEESELVEKFLEASSGDGSDKTATRSLKDIKKNMLHKLKTEMNIDLDTSDLKTPTGASVSKKPRKKLKLVRS